MPRNTIGVPIINLRHNVQDPETRRALDQLSQETTRWLQRIAEGVDTTSGLRGEPTYYADVNANSKRISKLAPPKDSTDAQIKDLALSRATSSTKSWDARGLPIINLPKDVPASQADATLTQEQIRAIIAEEIRNISDTLIAEPFVTVGNSALLTNERALTGTAGRISVTDGGANGPVTIDAVGAALTRTDDTNVTLTLGGAPTTALVNAASLTLGWTGQLAVARGGTGLASYTVGDLIYASGATTLTQLVDVAAGAYLRSGGIGVAPLWSTATLPNTATIGDVIYASAANVYGNLADVATGQVLASGGVGVAPAYTANPSVTSVVTTGQVQIGGNLNHDGANIGFFGVALVAQQLVAALTNNVTAGGVDDTIANFTDLVTYANDAATIRNDIYQLARKVGQLEVALSAYGLA